MSRSGAETYRAIVQRGHNAEHPESTLELASKQIPTAAPGHVVVHITIRPINPTDFLTIRSGRIAKDHLTPGSEGFGIVKTVGEGVTRVKPGQRVVPIVWQQIASGVGSWQEYVSVKEDLIIPIPDSISDEAAAQFIINPWTVIGMLKDQDVPKGEYLIQTAAGSVLGRQVIQLAKHLGFKTINIVRRPEQKEELFALGADEVICSKTEVVAGDALGRINDAIAHKASSRADIVARVKEITSAKLAYGAIDAVGGELTKALTASVRNSGQVFIYGVLGSTDATVGILDLFRGVSVRAWMLTSKLNEIEYFIKETTKLLEEKILVPLNGEKFDIVDFKKAIEKHESIGRGGKVFLTSP